MKRRRKKAKKRLFNKKRLTVFGISFLVILLAFIVIMGLGGLFPSVIDEDNTIIPIDKETGKINVLIVGVDKAEKLTDTIMVASYDLDDDTVNILSVPRDTRMYVGTRYQKINAAHTIVKDGKDTGINGTIEAVSRLTAIPINYYVEFTCSAFRETIDALGGVDFNVPQNMNYDDPAQDLHIHLKAGEQHLDGDKAEQLVRFRRYPMGDIDRVAVQQSFIKAVAQQKLNASIIPRLPELYKAIQKNLRTNIGMSEITKYLNNVADLTAENIKMYALPGSANGTDYGSSYWIADMTALADLIENTFGYDASEITIHSKDGKSVAKDVKLSTRPPEVTQKPVSEKDKSADSNKKDSGSASASKQTPKASEHPKATTAPTSAPTKKPEQTQAPVPNKQDTEKAEKEEKVIKRPQANKKED